MNAPLWVRMLTLLVVWHSPVFAWAFEVSPVGLPGSRLFRTESLATTRLDHIEEIFTGEQRPSRAWYWGWLGTYAALAVGQLSGSFITDSQESTDLRVLPQALYLVLYKWVSWICQRLEPSRSSVFCPSQRFTQRHCKLETAERLLRQSAKAQRRIRGRQVHLGGVVMSDILGILVFRYDRTRSDSLHSLAVSRWMTAGVERAK
ncbi:MAG: hypothetical protein R3C68_19425 [Myxococcota bacterium]